MGQSDSGQNPQPRDDAGAGGPTNPGPGNAIAVAESATQAAAPFVPTGRAAAFVDAPDPDERLSQAARDLILEGIPENTRATYRALWWVYVRWCGDTGREHLPAVPETVVEFVNHLGTQRTGRYGRPLSPNTIRSYLAVIAVAHNNAKRPERDSAGRHLIGWVSPTKARDVQLAMRAYSKRYLEAGHRPDRAHPLTPEEHAAIVGLLDERSPVDLNKITAFCLMYDGGFRRSELVAIRWEDVEIHVADEANVSAGTAEDEEDGDHLVVHVPMSKTDQAGEGDEVVLYAHPQDWADICPVRRVLQWRAMVQASDLPLTGPVVRIVRTGGKLPKPGTPRSGVITGLALNPATFQVWTRNLAREAGVAQGERRLKAHGYRRGSISRAASRPGANVAAIYRHYRFSKRSPVGMTYMEMGLKRSTNPVRRMFVRRTARSE